jgi:hypothetical protein
MAKHTIKGFIFLYVPMSTPQKPCYSFHASDISGDLFVKVMDHTVEFDVPDDFDPVPAQLAMLDKLEQEARQKLAKQLMEIEDRRSKLLSIEYTPSTAVATVLDDDFPF